MLFRISGKYALPLPPAARMLLAAAAWLIFIAIFHLWLNSDRDTRKRVRMGFMPVVTNLACPMLDYVTKETSDLRLKAIKFASFAEMAEALRQDEIQVAFMIAPLSIVLHQQGEDVRIVYIGNRHESTLVVRKDLNIRKLSDLSGRTLAVPMRYSGHNLGILSLMERQGLSGQINVVEMNPPDMAAALAAKTLDAYFVGEPFAVQTIQSGDAEVLHYVEDFWQSFICNLMLVKQQFIEDNPDVVRLIVQGAARSGIWAEHNPEAAARIASQYWNQPVDLIMRALSQPPDRIIYDQFMPRTEEIQQMADLMAGFGMIGHNNITGLVEDRFARAVSLEDVTDLGSVLRATR